MRGGRCRQKWAHPPPATPPRRDPHMWRVSRLPVGAIDPRVPRDGWMPKGKVGSGGGMGEEFSSAKRAQGSSMQCLEKAYHVGGHGFKYPPCGNSIWAYGHMAYSYTVGVDQHHQLKEIILFWHQYLLYAAEIALCG